MYAGNLSYRYIVFLHCAKSKYFDLFALPAIGKLMIYKDFYCITTSEYLSMQNSAQFKINGLDFSKFL